MHESLSISTQIISHGLPDLARQGMKVGGLGGIQAVLAVFFDAETDLRIISYFIVYKFLIVENVGKLDHFANSLFLIRRK